MKIKAAGKTDIGLKRKLNEDSILIAGDAGLFVIADGMGGHKAGEVASRMVIDTLADYWQKIDNNTPPAFLEAVTREISHKAKHLINSIALANALIHEAQKQPEYYKMGSTVSALLVEEDSIWLANVGDSPVYLYNRGRLTQISEEHSMAAEQRGTGQDQIQEASVNPLIKNVLTRVLGLHPQVNVYTTLLRPEPGDLLLMCSDGLTNHVSSEAISTVLADATLSLERKIDGLIAAANQDGGTDNISIILLECLAERGWRKLKRNLLKKIFFADN